MMQSHQDPNLTPTGLLETRSRRNTRWKASPGTRDLAEAETATAVARFNAERYSSLRGPVRIAPPPEPDQPETPLYSKLMIRRVTIAGTPVTIIQQPWMNEPRTYLTAETER